MGRSALLVAGFVRGFAAWTGFRVLGRVCGEAEPLAERVLNLSQEPEKRPSGANALVYLIAYMARLKSPQRRGPIAGDPREAVPLQNNLFPMFHPADNDLSHEDPGDAVTGGTRHPTSAQIAFW